MSSLTDPISVILSRGFDVWQILPWWYHSVAAAVLVLSVVCYVRDECKPGFFKEECADVRQVISIIMAAVLALISVCVVAVTWVVSLPLLMFMKYREQRDFTQEYEQLLRSA